MDLAALGRPVGTFVPYSVLLWRVILSICRPLRQRSTVLSSLDRLGRGSIGSTVLNQALRKYSESIRSISSPDSMRVVVFMRRDGEEVRLPERRNMSQGISFLHQIPLAYCTINTTTSLPAMLRIHHAIHLSTMPSIPIQFLCEPRNLIVACRIVTLLDRQSKVQMAGCFRHVFDLRLYLLSNTCTSDVVTVIVCR